MSVEDRVINSVYQLPKFRLTAAPRHVYSSQIQTDDSGYEPSSSHSPDSVQFCQGQQARSTVPVKNTFHVLQTQECSRKFSSAVLSSQTSASGCTATASNTAVTVNSDDHCVQSACIQSVGGRKTKSFPTSACTTPPHGSSSCCLGGSLMVPVVHHKNARHQRSENLTLQTNTLVIPGSTRNVVEQQKKDNDRSSTTSSQTRTAWNAKVDESEKNTHNAVSDSCSDAVTQQQRCINKSHNNVNNNNTLRQSDLVTSQLIDRASYRPASQCKLEAGSIGSPSYRSGAKRRINVAMLMQNGSIKSSEFTLTAAKCNVNSQAAPECWIAAPDNADCRSTSRSVTSELETCQPENAAVLMKQHANNVASYPEHPVFKPYEEPVTGIKIEKRLISNTPMTICTLPVPRPAFVCKSLLPETATPTKPSCSHSNTVARSYHETTRSQLHKKLPLTENGPCHSTEQRRSATISRLPYVGADLWELTTQRLQRAIIDKVSSGPENEPVSKAGCEMSSCHSPSTSPCLQHNAEHITNSVGRLVKKCLSAKMVRPETEHAIRASQSTSHLQQNFAGDEDEAAVDCDVEL